MHSIDEIFNNRPSGYAYKLLRIDGEWRIYEYEPSDHYVLYVPGESKKNKMFMDFLLALKAQIAAQASAVKALLKLK